MKPSNLINARLAIWSDLHEKAQAELARITAILKAHPDIGVLCRDGVVVYYVNAPEYREASDPSLLVEDPHANWKPKGRAGRFHIWHCGPNDYAVTDGRAGPVVYTADQFGKAASRAMHFNDHPEARP